jgi:outer membrane protein assembly factor BamB
VTRALPFVVVVGVLAQLGCRSIPLNEDPTVPQANVSPPALFNVAWFAPLVKIGLLEYQPAETATPAVDPDTERIVVSTRDGMVHCLSAKEGKLEWSLNTHGRPFAGATIVDGVAYIPGGDGVLYAVRVSNGQTLWEYKAAEELVTAPTVHEGRVVIASQTETVFAVDRETGKWVWQYRRDPPTGFSIRGTATPVVSGDRVLMGFADGYLVSLGFEDGVARWERKLTTSGGAQFLDVDSTVAVDTRGHVFASSYKDGVYALDIETGDIEWNTARPGITGLLLNGSTLFLTGDGSLSALETGKGKLLWSLDLSDRTSKARLGNAGRPLTMSRGYVVVPTSTGLAFVEPTAGRVREVWNPGRGITATPTRYDSRRLGPRLYVLTNMGTLYALDMVSRG